MFSTSNIAIHGGIFNNNQNRTSSRGMDILLEWVATGAFHNSDELYDAPKCHPRTRLAVLNDIMQWVSESESTREDFMLWLFGPAGAGKSAIAKRIAEIAADMGMLIATFFFSRTSSTRSNKDRLIATLAYQLALSIPSTKSYIEIAIEEDPTIFRKNIQTQIDTLLIKPLQSISSTQIASSKNLIVIDGLDECNDSKAQVAILKAISRSFIRHNPPIIFLVASRSEPDIDTSFNCDEPLRFIHRRLALDDTYRPDDDIRLFFYDSFEHIKRTHPLRSTIPISWPTQETLETLVAKSSGQFIYASTVVKFVESKSRRPSARLDIILGILPPGRTNPFSELDGLYNHLLSSVDDIKLTLRVLSFYVMTPRFAYRFQYSSSMLPELFLSLQPGDIQFALINLASVVSYHGSSGDVEILHASLVDFLSDKRRSATFYIDIATTCSDFVRRILQYAKGPDGIQAGNISLFSKVNSLYPWILKRQIRSDILDFDIDAFINASIRRCYKLVPNHPPYPLDTYRIWKQFLIYSSLKDRYKQQALDRCKKFLESRLQIYHSDWRLQLLLTLAVIYPPGYYGRYEPAPYCKCVDILLEMDDHDLHLVDQNALDLRHRSLSSTDGFIPAMISSYVDGDAYASAAIHCMRFLFHPPIYYKRKDAPEIGLRTYAEWKRTCVLTLDMLCDLLQHANTTPELVFISNYDIHPAVQKCLSADRLLKADVHFLAFLSRASVFPNRRIISAIQRSLSKPHQRPSQYAISDQDEEWKATQHLIPQRPVTPDQCCSNLH